MRARDLEVAIGDYDPGRWNAITDVDGVRVGHATLIEGDSIRTGVTVVIPSEVPLFAGCHRLNGNGELTGLEWIRESGLLTTPIGITNTFSVGVVRDAIAARSADEDGWSLAVVARPTTASSTTSAPSALERITSTRLSQRRLGRASRKGTSAAARA